MALDQHIYFVAGFAVFLCAMASKTKLETFYNYACILVIIQSILGIFQMFGMDLVVKILNLFAPARPIHDPLALTGTFGNNNWLAAYVAICLPMFFRIREYRIFVQPRWYVPKKRWATTITFTIKWSYFIPLLIFVLYFCKTTSAVVPAIVGTVYYFYPRIDKKYLWAAICAAFVAAMAYGTLTHGNFWENQRIKDWDKAFHLWGYNPFSVIFGMGPSAAWGKSYPLHNEWMQCLYEYGLIGFGLLVGYVASVSRKNRILFTAFVIAAINMIGNYSLHLAPSAFLIILIAGFMEREKIRGIING
jgi:hypothetical protein